MLGLLLVDVADANIFVRNRDGRTQNRQKTTPSSFMNTRDCSRISE